jgi:hypothetical protein
MLPVAATPVSTNECFVVLEPATLYKLVEDFSQHVEIKVFADESGQRLFWIAQILPQLLRLNPMAF